MLGLGGGLLELQEAPDLFQTAWQLLDETSVNRSGPCPRSTRHRKLPKDGPEDMAHALWEGVQLGSLLRCSTCDLVGFVQPIHAISSSGTAPHRLVEAGRKHNRLSTAAPLRPSGPLRPLLTFWGLPSPSTCPQLDSKHGCACRGVRDSG